MADQLALLPSPLVPTHDAIREQLTRAGLRDSSIRRYASAARSWLQYCADHEELPHEATTMTLVRWLDARCRGSRSPASMVRVSLAAARFVQRAASYETEQDPLPYTRHARSALDAYARTATLQAAPPRRARPMRLDLLARVVASVRSRVSPRRSVAWERARYLAARDSALLLACWWGALRADDAAQLAWGDVEHHDEGVLLTLQRSKTGAAKVACAAVEARALCPRAALEELAEAAARVDLEANGPVFRLASGHHVARRIKTVFRAHGAEGYTSHSLRSGFATEAASQSVPDRLVQLHARWSSAQQHSAYVRDGRLWLDTPTARISVEGCSVER